MSRPAVLQLHLADDVAIATRLLAPGEEVGPDLRVQERIPAGHKIAVAARLAGEPVRKYGQIIGFASRAIAVGEHVHEHNLAAGAFDRELPPASAIPAPHPAPLAGAGFQGYRRADGRIGTRNYIAVISSVNCAATVSRFIVERFPVEELAGHPTIDGLIALNHKGGCTFQPGGREHRHLERVMRGFALHPNVGAYLLVGLGCETNALDQFVGHADLGRAPVPVLGIQQQGGTAATVAAGIEELRRLLPLAAAARREPVPAAGLCLGMECGGSDGNSGITANPVIGAAADRVIAHGGRAVLAETPEIYGAEHLLTARARTPAVAAKLMELVAWWEDYAEKFGASINNNPTTGNKAGGLTTIYEKSLGAVAKAGGSALEAVYDYAETVTAPGLSFMDSPGFDPASVTGMVAGGANLVLFSTGRGSCFGCKPSPTIKIASNSTLAANMPDDMDFDAGRVLDGAGVDELGEELFAHILRVASGEPTASERLGYGDEEFCPWSVGPVF